MRRERSTAGRSTPERPSLLSSTSARPTPTSRRSGSRGSSPRPGWSSRSGSRSCSAGSSGTSTAAPGRTARGGPRGWRRSSGAPRPTGCRRSSGPSPGRANMLTAMRVATFAKQTGRTIAFSLAAFRQAFAAGKDLTDPDNVMIAAAACELHPRALESGQDATSSKTGLARGDRRGRGGRRLRRPQRAGRRGGLLGRRPARGSGEAVVG